VEPVAIVADVHERASCIPEMLESFEAKVDGAQLHAGDYALADALVERKSVADLPAAVANGTFWRQVGKLRHAGPTLFLLVEGEKLDQGSIPSPAIRGVCIAAIELGIRLIRTESRDDSALWLYRLGVRRSEHWKRDRPAYAQRRRPHGADQAANVIRRVGGAARYAGEPADQHEVDVVLEQGEEDLLRLELSHA
jgi:ERCC4-type nuclease